MKFIITLALFVVVAVSALPHKQIRPLMPRLRAGSNRIEGGSPAELGQFPYQAALYTEKPTGTYFCGGTLIGSQWVLASAFCAFDGIRFTIALGIIDLYTTNVQVTSSQPAIIYPDYVENQKPHDIALIRLDSTVQFNAYILPVTLNGAPIGGGQNAFVSGWGYTSEYTTVSQFLNWAALQTMDNVECTNPYTAITDGMICANSVGTPQGICTGDQGGPLVVSEGPSTLLIGIVSFRVGTSCGSGLPSGFTRISFYRNWIRAVSGI